LWRLYPSPSQVHHLHSACQALYLLHHHSCLPNHAHHLSLHDHLASLR
jgi:hypothetical protein